MKILKNIIAFILFPVLLVSCFKDTSSLDNNSNDTYFIQAEKNKSFRVSVIAGEKLKINPDIFKLRDRDTIRNIDEELTYAWKIMIDPENQDTTGFVISESKNLDAVVPIPAKTTPYDLLLIITDKKTGLQANATWKLTQSAIYNSGLIVADTDDNGISSDISMILANDVSDFLEKNSEPMILRNIFSSNNFGTKLQGEVSFIKDGRCEYMYQLSFICENTKSMARVDALDFTVIDRDQERFLIPQDYFAPTYLGNGYKELYLVNNGIMNCQDWQQNETMSYGYPMESDDLGYYCGKWYAHASNDYTGADDAKGVIYDELNGRFLKMPGTFTGAIGLQKFKANNGGAFDPNDVKNKTCEMAGQMSDGRNIFILRDKTTKNLSMYILAANLDDDNGKIGLEIIDMTNFEGVNEVVSYVVSTKELVIYYATKNKIYAILMTGVPRVEPRYTTPAGTIITTMSLIQNWYLTYVYKTEIDKNGKEVDYKLYLDGRVLSIALYNESTKEGTIRNQYIETLNAGIFSEKYIWEHKGFKKITSVLSARYSE